MGTHNSYHLETPKLERKAHRSLLGIFDSPRKYEYSHARLQEQLHSQSVRGVELDIWADPGGGLYADPLVSKKAGVDFLSRHPSMTLPGIKVLHKASIDISTTCYSLIDCLDELKRWSRANTRHVPISVILELKYRTHLVNAEPWNTTNLDILDSEIRSVFSPEMLVTPDDVRRPGYTLEESMLHFGWPTLESSRGKFFFLMDNQPRQDPGIRQAYREGRESLEGRVVFTNSVPGQPDAVFIKHNNPRGRWNLLEIQHLVRKGYYVRTRADTPYSATVEWNLRGRQEAAFKSGAQLVSTDYPAPGMSKKIWRSRYSCQLPGAETVRCNPVNSPASCQDAVLEIL